MNPLFYFTDPILRAPTVGSMLMCLSAALVGVVVFLRKESLLGEALAHASYPGVILGVIAAGAFGLESRYEGALLPLLIMGGAFVTALLGMWAIYLMTRVFNVRSDAALCFVLSSFFGIGIALVSQVQFTFATLYQKAQVYLYGQAATMTDLHIRIYGVLALVVIGALFLFYKELQLITFDAAYAKSLGFPVRFIEALFLFMAVLAIIIGIRSVGVVLMSAMLIAPAAAARQYTHRLSVMFLLAALFGLASGFLGNFLSAEFSAALDLRYPGSRLSIPTGPMIVMTAAALCLLSLFLAPERGLFLRALRIAKFRYKRICENLLKALWRLGPKRPVSFEQVIRFQSGRKGYLRFIMARLVRTGWVKRIPPGKFRLTEEGERWAAKIVRLHRLWEVYLANYLEVGADRVHRSAEEMEHIITPELERELELLLENPKEDPHHQPIPEGG